MSFPQQWLHRNFEIIYRLLELAGQNVFDPNHRPNWRTVYTGTIVLIALVELPCLMWMKRSDLFEVLYILLTFLFTCVGLQNVIVSAIRSEKILALKTKLTEILDILDETKSNGPIICRVLQISCILQKFLQVLYMTSASLVLLIPVFLWLVLGKKILLFLFVVPGTDANTAEGFLLDLILHAYLLVGAYRVYTAHECMFIAFIMPIGAYVNAFGNEVKELNLLLNLPERNDSAIRDQLNRIVKIHQTLNEYEKMMQDLFKFVILNKIGLIYLGIISAILVILTMSDPIAYIFLALLFEQLTKSCLMGTIITVKNEQLLDHIYGIHWYLLSIDQAKQIGFMLHMAQNPTSVTIGKFAPLNVESYKSLINSIYSYVMVLITFLK